MPTPFKLFASMNRIVLAAAAGGVVLTAFAAGPSPTSPQQPGPSVPAATPPPGAAPPPAPTCGNQAYACPPGASCLALAAVPAGGPVVLGASYDAYRCMFPPIVGTPGSPPLCPAGLQLAYMPAQGKISAATPVCAPPADACPRFHRSWLRTTPVMPLPLPLLGYTCRYKYTG